MTSRSKRQSGRRRQASDNSVTHGYRASFSVRHAHWEDSVARLVAAIERLRHEPQPMGAVWAANQVAYFESRLAELRGYEPKK